VSGEQVPPSPTREWQIPMGAQIKNSAKTNTRVPPPTDIKTYKTKIANGLGCRAQDQLKKKKKLNKCIRI